MSEIHHNQEEQNPNFSLISQRLDEAVAAFAQAQEERDAAMRTMKDYLQQHVGQQLPITGHATWVGFSNPSKENSEKIRWSYVSLGSILDYSWDSRVLRAGEYTVCGVNEDNTIDISWPGEEQIRRLRAPIVHLRAATREEIKAARSPKAD